MPDELAAGFGRPFRRRKLIRRLVLGLQVMLASFLAGTAAAQQAHTLVGDMRVHKSFHSKILNNKRDVLVYLPPAYDAHEKHYPVLYLNDGQNLFDGATSFIPGEEWRVDETAQSLISAGEIEPLIIVGVYNTGKDRINEYTPAEDERFKMGGKADLYGRMLIEELKPFIDATYRTRKDAKHTGLGGSSLGGLVSLYLGLKYSHVFSRIAVLSPSVWFANKQILRYLEALKKKPNLRIWLDTGTREGRSPNEAQQTVVDARLLKETLERKGWRLGKDLRYFEAEGADHSERAWAARLELILRFLFPRKM